jgi:hypothetical protein
VVTVLAAVSVVANVAVVVYGTIVDVVAAV